MRYHCETPTSLKLKDNYQEKHLEINSQDEYSQNELATKRRASVE